VRGGRNAMEYKDEFGNLKKDPEMMSDLELQQALDDLEISGFEKKQLRFEDQMRQLERDPTRPEY